MKLSSSHRALAVVRTTVPTTFKQYAHTEIVDGLVRGRLLLLLQSWRIRRVNMT